VPELGEESLNRAFVEVACQQRRSRGTRIYVGMAAPLGSATLSGVADYYSRQTPWAGPQGELARASMRNVAVMHGVARGLRLVDMQAAGWPTDLQSPDP
jgi:cytochrome c553